MRALFVVALLLAPACIVTDHAGDRSGQHHEQADVDAGTVVVDAGPTCPTLEVAPASLDFGALHVGEYAAPQVITLTAHGGEIEITDVGFTETTPPREFELRGSFVIPSFIAAETSMTMVFAAHSFVAASSASGFHITSDDCERPVVTVPLTLTTSITATPHLISVNGSPVDAPPAFAAGDVVVVSAEGSAPSQGATLTTYSWSVVDVPAASHGAVLQSPNLQECGLTLDAIGTYALELVVADDTGASDVEPFNLVVTDPATPLTAILFWNNRPSLTLHVARACTGADDDATPMSTNGSAWSHPLADGSYSLSVEADAGVVDVELVLYSFGALVADVHQRVSSASRSSAATLDVVDGAPTNVTPGGATTCP